MPDSLLVEAERGACSINDGPSQGAILVLII
jgi:hypothetical protein